MAGAEQSQRFVLGYRPALDGLRAVAVLVVMARHTGLPLMRGGYLGVDFFFVLSGFLITALILEDQRNGTFAFARFYARRALRLLPALGAVLLAATAFAFAFDSPTAERTRGGLLPTLLYVSNIVRAAFDWELGVLNHTWSLAIEEQFYLLWPPLLLWSLRSGGKRRARTSLIVILGLGVTTTAIRYLSGVSSYALYNGLESHGVILLMAGCLFALWLHEPTTNLDRARDVARRVALPAVVVTACVFFAFNFSAGFFPLGGYAVVALCAVAVIGFLTLHGEAWPSRVLSTPLLVGIGRISYGLYLWHYVVYYVALDRFPSVHKVPLMAGAVLASFAVAAASYFIIERPFLRLKRRFTSSPRRATIPDVPEVAPLSP